MKRKLLSVMLSIAMSVTMISITTTNIYAQDFTGWTVLTDGGTLNAGNYYLESNVTLTNNIVFSGGDVTLDLNGYVLKGNGNGSVITVNGGNLTIQDSNPNNTHTEVFASLPTGGCITGGTGTLKGNEYLGGGIYIVSGSLVMNGGTIYSCNATKGGGVFTWGNFTMNNSSAIVNCAATVDGGGVCACKCLFAMNNNSKVSECVADNGAGGVYIWGDNIAASFTMNGNSIISNCEASATHSNKRSGGGVCVEGNLCSFTMNGGNIINNIANNNNNGGGVQVFSGTFNMNGGTINQNNAGHGGGIHVNGGAKVNITNGYIKNNHTSQSGGAVQVDGDFIMSGGTIEINKADNDGGGLSVNGYSGKAILTGTAKIINNTANNQGGGVSYYNNPDKVFLGGSVQITGNVKGGEITKGELSGGSANNVYLYAPTLYVTLGTSTNGSDGNKVLKPAEGMRVGITSIASSTDTTPVKITNNGTANDVNYFTSDNADYMLTFNSSNHLELAKIVAYNCTKLKEYPTLAKAIGEAVSGDEIELRANNNAENIILPNGVTLFAKSGYTGTVTTNVTGKAIAKQEMLGSFQYKYSVADLLTITYKDQGNLNFSGSHENGYPTTFMAEVPTQLKAATKNGYTFGGWFDNVQCNGNPITNFDAYTYTDNLTLYAKWAKNSGYTITKGNNARININDNKDFSFTSNADFIRFDKVKVDDIVITKDTDYVVEEGSTKVTLKASYLNTLSVGQHTIDIISTDGHASTTFTITKNSPSSNPGYVVPNTGVEGAYSNNHSLLKLSSLSLLAIGTYIVIKKKKNN